MDTIDNVEALLDSLLVKLEGRIDREAFSEAHEFVEHGEYGLAYDLLVHAVKGVPLEAEEQDMLKELECLLQDDVQASEE